MDILRFQLSFDKGGTTGNKMFLQWCRDELVKSFIFVQSFRFVGQDAASKRHHCRNTNVTANAQKDFTHMTAEDYLAERILYKRAEIITLNDWRLTSVK